MGEIFHPVAELWPMLPEAELAELVEDIRTNGLRYPIWRHRDGRIIDGRNRWLACQKADVACPSETYAGPDGADLVAFAVSLNERRRHLTDSQRAAIAADLPARGHGRPSAAEKAHGCAFSDAEAARLLGVSERAVEYAKAVKRADPDLHQRVKRGELTLAEARRALDGGRLPPPAIGTGEVEWYTPAEYVEAARAVMGGIDLDPASSDVAQRTVRAAAYHTAAMDGLAHPWRGRIFLNPPYQADLMSAFVARLLAEHAAGNVSEAVLLVHSRTDAAWFHAAVRVAAAVCLTRGRIRFEQPAGTGDSPTTGSAFFYFGDQPGRFAATFGRLGVVLRTLEAEPPRLDLEDLAA
jgi:DNA N-6-adenine-methyltransferase (Dam)/ParB/Sulfiredoxin domain